MPSGYKAFNKAMAANGWTRLGDHRYQHANGKELYGETAYRLYNAQALDMLAFHAHDTREDEPVTEHGVAEEIYGVKTANPLLTHNQVFGRHLSHMPLALNS